LGKYPDADFVQVDGEEQHVKVSVRNGKIYVDVQIMATMSTSPSRFHDSGRHRKHRKSQSRSIIFRPKTQFVAEKKLFAQSSFAG